MRIFIFHYHLNPGGVTRIIESQIAGFKKVYPEIELHMVTGFCETKDFFISHKVFLHENPHLNYLPDRTFNSGELEQEYEKIYHYLAALIVPSDIIHAHNLNLGKNPVLTLVFNQLLFEGYHIVNHAHDFSEDRPINQAYLSKIITDHFGKELKQVMYPDHHNALIGVINRNDFNRVLTEGFSNERLFLYHNPVYIPMDELPDKSERSAFLHATFHIPVHKKIITYPVRVIRRKNIGELVLLAVIFKDCCQFLVTLPPRNPVEIEQYHRWTEFCKTHSIDIIFEAGEKAEFVDLIAGSDFCITTSIKEGFGMTFLEPWLIGTPVIGRNLSYVTDDITSEGVKLNFVYNQLTVIYQDNKLDFKYLSTTQQQNLILQVKSDYLYRKQIVELNPVLNQFPPSISANEIETNRKIVAQKFSIIQYAERIYSSYRKVFKQVGSA